MRQTTQPVRRKFYDGGQTVKTIYLHARAQDQLNRYPTYPDQGKLIFPSVNGLPEIKSDEPAYLEFMRSVRRELMEAQPVSESADGLYDSRAIAKNWSSASFVAGYPMRQATCPPVDNGHLVDEMGLARPFLKPRHREIYHNFFSLMYSPRYWTDTTAHFNPLSSTGAPYRIGNNISVKMLILDYALAHWYEIADLLMRGKFEEAARVFAAACLYVLGFRAQSSDGVTYDPDTDTWTVKERLVNDIVYEMTGGKHGWRGPSDRSLVLNSETLKDMFRVRLRTVYGAPGWMTYPFTTLLSMARESYFERYAFTYKHRGGIDIRDKIREFVGSTGGVCSLDVSQYDQSFSREMVDAYLDEWSRILPEPTAWILRYSFRMPFVLPNPQTSESGAVLIGDPGKQQSFAYGLPSGVAINPDMGKFHVPATLMMAFDDLYDDIHTEEQIETFLRGEHRRVGLLNSGDDSVVMVRNSDDLEDVRTAITRPTGWYFKLQPEDAGAFLGNVLYRNSAGDVDVAPDIFSLFANWWMPERGVDHRSRRDFWALGFVQRQSLYQAAPGFDVANRVINEQFRRVFKADPLDYTKGQVVNSQMPLLDQLAIAKPERLHYSIDANELTDAVRDSLVASVPADLVAKATERLLEPHSRWEEGTITALTPSQFNKRAEERAHHAEK